MPAVRFGHIASYQYKDPFGLLEMEPSGTFKNSWWAIVDGLVTVSSATSSHTPYEMAPVPSSTIPAS